GSIVAAPRLRRNAPDLVAEMFPSSTDDGARLGIALRTGGSLDASRLEKLRAALGSSPHHLLVAISRRSDLQRSDDGRPAGRVTRRGGRLCRRRAKVDQGHAALWATIGQVREHCGRPRGQLPLEAKKLLTTRRGAQEFRARLGVAPQAGPPLLGSS